MKLRLKRIFKGDKYTIGRLYVDDEYLSDTLEDTDRGLNSKMPLDILKSKKVYGKTAIPTGTYTIDMNTVSPKFKDRAWAKIYDGKVPRLLSVPGYDGVLIHPSGNKPEDTLGCILVGQNKVKGQVINSTATFNKLMELLLKSKEVITMQIE